MRYSIILSIVVLLIGCSRDTARSKVEASSPGVLPDPVGHAVPVHTRPWSTELAPNVKVVQADPQKTMRQQEVRTDNAAAFVVPRSDPAETPIEYVYLERDGKTYRIEGVPLDYRPISGVAWASSRYLVFDRLSQPHHGVHYVVDTVALRVVHVAVFPSEFLLKQQQSSLPDGRDGS
jgi:hypothetical protein